MKIFLLTRVARDKIVEIPVQRKVLQSVGGKKVWKKLKVPQFGSGGK